MCLCDISLVPGFTPYQSLKFIKSIWWVVDCNIWLQRYVRVCHLFPVSKYNLWWVSSQFKQTIICSNREGTKYAQFFDSHSHFKMHFFCLILLKFCNYNDVIWLQYFVYIWPRCLWIIVSYEFNYQNFGLYFWKSSKL